MAWTALQALFDTAWDGRARLRNAHDSQRMLLQAPLDPGGAVTFPIEALLVLSSRLEGTRVPLCTAAARGCQACSWHGTGVDGQWFGRWGGSC